MDYRVQLAIKLMKSDLARELSLSEIASHVHLSPSRLRYLFKNETGLGPKGYMRTLRTKLTKNLLESTSLTVEQIMIQVGASDRSHFERRFKKANGITPIQYRAAARFVALAREDEQYVPRRPSDRAPSTKQSSRP